MGNELSSGGEGGDGPYDELNGAIDRGDLDAVRRLIEVDGLDPNGAPGGSGWDRPLMTCMNADKSDGSALRIARYLHSKGAEGYSVSTAVTMDDLERVRDLVDSGEEDVDAARACRLIRKCRGADVARWLFDRAGPDSDREAAYPITEACGLGDLDRIKTLAAAPDFDINRGYLEPMPGCGNEIVPYTTEAEREKLNQHLIKKHGRCADIDCTMLVYPLQEVCKQDPFQPEVAAYLINDLGADMEIMLPAFRRGEGNVTLLANVVSLGRLEVAKFLIKQGAKAPWESDSGRAARCLLDAASNDSTELLQFFLGDEEMAKCFDLSCVDKFGRTPLNLACVLERKENVEYLLRRATAAVSPDDVRAACEQCNPSILTLLLDNGGALPPGNEVVTMIPFGDDEKALAVLKLLRGRGADLTAPYVHLVKEEGKTLEYFALHAATMGGAASCVEYLLAIGADPHAVGCCPDHEEPGTADDWEGNFDLQYSNVYGDGINHDPRKVGPVKALFERAREARRGGKKAAKQGGEGEEKRAEDDDGAWIPAQGDSVKIKGLAKAAQYNGMEGVVTSSIDPKTKRCGVKVKVNGNDKTLGLQLKNMSLLYEADGETKAKRGRKKARQRH